MTQQSKQCCLLVTDKMVQQWTARYCIGRSGTDCMVACGACKAGNCLLCTPRPCSWPHQAPHLPRKVNFLGFMRLTMTCTLSCSAAMVGWAHTGTCPGSAGGPGGSTTRNSSCSRPGGQGVRGNSAQSPGCAFTGPHQQAPAGVLPLMSGPCMCLCSSSCLDSGCWHQDRVSCSSWEPLAEAAGVSHLAGHLHLAR